MIHFRKLFEKLESLRHLDADDNTNLWALRSTPMLEISKRIDEFKERCIHYHLPGVVHKSSGSICLTSSLNNQVVNSNKDLETIRHLSEWQNVPLLSTRGLIANPPILQFTLNLATIKSLILNI